MGAIQGAIQPPAGVTRLAQKEMSMLYDQTRETYAGQGFQASSGGEKPALQAVFGGGQQG